MPNSINPVSTSPAQTGITQTEQSRVAQEIIDAGRQAIAADGSDTSARAAEEPTSPSPRELAQATRYIADYIQTVSRTLNISVDNNLGTTVIQVLDTETDELVRQIPAEEALQLARFLSDQQVSADNTAPIPGFLIDQDG